MVSRVCNGKTYCVWAQALPRPGEPSMGLFGAGGVEGQAEPRMTRGWREAGTCPVPEGTMTGQ